MLTLGLEAAHQHANKVQVSNWIMNCCLVFTIVCARARVYNDFFLNWVWIQFCTWLDCEASECRHVFIKLSGIPHTLLSIHIFSLSYFDSKLFKHFCPLTPDYLWCGHQATYMTRVSPVEKTLCSSFSILIELYVILVSLFWVCLFGVVFLLGV